MLWLQLEMRAGEQYVKPSAAITGSLSSSIVKYLITTLLKILVRLWSCEVQAGDILIGKLGGDI